MIYLGLNVLTEDPNRRDEPTHTASRSKVRIDSITGPFTEVEKGAAQRQSRPFSWYMDSRQAINEYRDFLSAQKGRLVPFWIPTWHHDIRSAGDISGSSGVVDIEYIGYTRHQFNTNTTWRRHLAFIQIGVGVNQIRRIDASIELVGTEKLTLDAATGIDMPKDQWMLSFLTLCRLNTDSVTLHWHSPTVAEATFEVIELPQEMPVVPV
jgi:hypothetical protein